MRIRNLSAALQRFHIRQSFLLLRNDMISMRSTSGHFQIVFCARNSSAHRCLPLGNLLCLINIANLYCSFTSLRSVEYNIIITACT